MPNSATRLAEKYRPTRFKDIVGQSHIVQTIANGLKLGMLRQVYLFIGCKGTGKTTTARLFSQLINCKNKKSIFCLEESYSDRELCSSCLQFKNSTSWNMYELDAASHNSVKDIHLLMEQIMYIPAHGKKIFIIDEAHMLSTSAFNALLKTLEEPPQHVVFILITTDEYKILPTVRDRCQIFYFNSIPTRALIDRMIYIASKENIQYEEKALRIIAQQAMGSLRDALHLLDLVTTFSGNNQLTVANVLTHLHILDDPCYERLTSAIMEKDGATLLKYYRKVIEKNFNSQQFLLGFQTFVHNILVNFIIQNPLVDGVSSVDYYKEQGKKFPKKFLQKLVVALQKSILDLKKHPNTSLYIEVFLLQCIEFVEVTSPKVICKPITSSCKLRVKNEVNTPIIPKGSLNVMEKKKSAVASSPSQAVQSFLSKTTLRPESTSKKECKLLQKSTILPDRDEVCREKEWKLLQEKKPMLKILSDQWEVIL